MTPARFALGLEYDGSGFHGWQSQSGSPNVQDAVNRALSRVADEEVRCMGAGRTDAGVHAVEQVAHFDTSARRSRRAWLFGANTYLPDDINLLWVREVAGDFHARHSAVARTYAYLILNRSVRSALERNRAWLIRDRLDDEAMHRAAQVLAGEHDFSSWRAADCQARSPVRNVMDIRVRRSGERVWIVCRANGFLQRMVRNIAGSLAHVGRGRKEGAWIAEVLEARSRTAAGPAAPPQGLYLQRIEYPPALLPQGSPASLDALLHVPEDI